MQEINLDAARAARGETKGDPIVIVFGGEKFECAPDVSIEFAWLVDRGMYKPALRELLRDRFDDFYALGPTIGDMTSILEGLAKTSALEVPEGK